MLLNRIFYTLKPAIPRRVQIFLRRQFALYKRKKYAHIWPIDPASSNQPKDWPGWPEGKKFALVLSHDVDTQKGLDGCYKLMELEKELGFRSCFNFVPERYKNSDSMHKVLRQEGFDIAVHGLKHDGKLFFSKKIFNDRAQKINRYLDEWKTTGFTSPSMHHKLDWLVRLNIDYSISTFDTDPFEPQPDGVGTIFPFLVHKNSSGSAASWPHNLRASKQSDFFVELPYTLPQDFTLFVILQEKDNRLWKSKLDWIAERGGMVLLNTHSDYMNFSGGRNAFAEYNIDLYSDFLKYIKQNYEQYCWNVLPVDVARFIRELKTA